MEEIGTSAQALCKRQYPGVMVLRRKDRKEEQVVKGGESWVLVDKPKGQSLNGAGIRLIHSKTPLHPAVPWNSCKLYQVMLIQ